MSSTDSVADSAASQNWRLWLIALLLALLFHAFLLMTHVHWPSAARPPRVQIQNIDPRKLEEIRKKWDAKNAQKPILLDKNPKAKTDEPPPPDAKYMSDRNHRVEKEQRAKMGEVLPKPGQPTAPTHSEAQPKPRAEAHPPATQSRRLPDLGNLGLKYRLGADSKPKTHSESKAAAHDQPPPPAQRGADQWLRDRDIPEGSENILNTQESVYYSFYARLYEAIGPLWQSKINELGALRKLREGDYTTNVDVVMDREGNLVAVNLLQSSGVRDFDNAVDDSWKKVGRFPNPPTGLLDEQQQVHTGWSFTVHVGMGGPMRFLPPERQY
jgi:TonB family protein